MEENEISRSFLSPSMVGPGLLSYSSSHGFSEVEVSLGLDDLMKFLASAKVLEV